ncbi:GTPase, partial [Nocardioides sp. P5_C9_2]
SGDMLDAILEALPETPEQSFGEIGGPRRIAIVGKPNVGKSSLLNQLAGEDRVVVDNVAGTTVDPVDELIELGDRTWRFIDTAGIRKRVKEASGHEYYASLRTSTAIDRAEVAVLVLDAGLTVSEQDMRIIQTIRDAGRAMIIAFNKWDLVDDERRYYLEREVERDLVQVQWAPRINITARTGWHVDRLVPALDKALEGWETRVPTGALNTFLGRLVGEHPHPVRSGKQPKILFATQPSTSPPTFILFTSGKLDASYERFVERRLREQFGFVGTPIVIQQRPREKRKR